MLKNSYLFVITDKKLIVMLLMFLLTTSNFLSADEKEVSYSLGMLSLDESDHLDIEGEMVVSSEWITIFNRSNLHCKWLNKNISVDDLKKLVVFEDKDLVENSEENKKNYDESSVYFETCNYVSGYKNPFYHWGVNKNTLLEWPGTDAFIDGKYAVLLIAYLDREKKYVRALYIDKEHQNYSNRKEAMNIFNWDGFN